MSPETRELRRICELLDGSAGDANKQGTASNLNLLKYIVNKLSPERAGDNPENHTLVSDRISDSLAFPSETRANRAALNRPELWDNLENFNDVLKQDYSSRRQMLLNRLDCTVESFKWKASGKSANNQSKNSPINDQIHERYEQARLRLKEEPDVTVSHLLALRETECDILLNYVASSSNTDCKVVYKDRPQKQGDLIYLKRVVIPEVPDRGGRTGEIRAPQKETISQQRHARGRGGRR